MVLGKVVQKKTAVVKIGQQKLKNLMSGDQVFEFYSTFKTTSRLLKFNIVLEKYIHLFYCRNSTSEILMNKID